MTVDIAMTTVNGCICSSGIARMTPRVTTMVHSGGDSDDAGDRIKIREQKMEINRIILENQNFMDTRQDYRIYIYQERIIFRRNKGPDADENSIILKC